MMNMNMIARLAERLRDRVSAGVMSRNVRQSFGVVASISSAALFTVTATAQVGSFNHGGESYRVVPATSAEGLTSLPSAVNARSSGGNEAASNAVAAYAPLAATQDSQSITAGLISSTPQNDPAGLFSRIAQVGHHSGRTVPQSGGCQSCGQPNCGGTCSVGSMACPTCEPYCYGIGEILYMRNEGMDGTTYSRSFALDEPDFEPGIRVTIGNSPNCVSGNEVSFMGVLSWETENSIQGPDRLSPFFMDGTAIPTNNTGAIVVPPSLLDPGIRDTLFVFGADPRNRADAQSQRYESEMWSFEASRTMIAWDVAKFLVGARYLNLEEEFLLRSQNSYLDGANNVQTGRGGLLSETSNGLVGMQVGADVFNPIGRFSSTYLRARAGAYLNLAEANVSTSFAPTIAANEAVTFTGSSDDSDIAGMFEIGSGLRYQLGEMLAVRAGTELWYLTGVATADRQAPTMVNPAFNPQINSNADIFYFGFTVGAELKY